MLPTDDSASAPDFTRAAVRVFAQCGFSAPAAAETCVLLCDTMEWTSLVESARGLLSPEERARAIRLRFDRDRTPYILAHALWRVSLAICLGTDVTRIRLISTVTGQPQLPGTAFATSLSHSGCWVAIAICMGETVGVDIERSPPRTALETLVPTICTPAEIADLAPLPAPEREAALLALWTRKEALLKAFGVGLDVDPSRLSVTANEVVSSLPSPTTSDLAPCRVFNLRLPDGVVGALAVPVSIASVRICALGSVKAH
jgi:4'-phosphopantetheinyl transferase